jgi:hypothetical protein
MRNSPDEFYHALVTQKSWEELTALRKLLDFILIGGWAVYFYTKALKSKDIDIIINYDQLPLLSQHYQLFKNERLHKYEAVKGEVQIDIYLPHMAQIGVPVEEIIKHTRPLEGFTVVDINLLFAMKIFTLLQRGRTPKGRKDFLDLIALFASGKCELTAVSLYLKKFQIENAKSLFFQLLAETTQIDELALNAHRFSKIKKKLLEL